MDALLAAIFGVVEAVLTPVLAAVCGYLVARWQRTNRNAEEIKKALAEQAEELKRFSEGNDEGTIVLMQIAFWNFYERFVERSEPMTIARHEQIEKLWHAYHDGMKQDGSITPIYERLIGISPHVIGSDFYGGTQTRSDHGNEHQLDGSS